MTASEAAMIAMSKNSDWSQRTGPKMMSTRDETYMLMFNSDSQFEAFDNARPDEAFKKKSFSKSQQHDFRTSLMLHKNRLAEKLKQANLDLKEKKEYRSRSGKHQEVIHGRKVLVSDKTYNGQSGEGTATLISEQDAVSAHHTSGDEVQGEIYVPVDISYGTLSDENSSVISSKIIKQEYDKTQLYFDDDTVPMSSDNCTITTSSSTLSYDRVLEMHIMRLKFTT